MSRLWRIYVSYREDEFDPASRRILWEVGDLGVEGVERVKAIQGFKLEGPIDEDTVKRICEELLYDPIVQQYTYIEGDHSLEWSGWVVEVKYKPGVFDSLASSTVEASRIIGVSSLNSVETFTVYVLFGDLDYRKVELIARRCLANPIVHSYRIYPPCRGE